MRTRRFVAAVGAALAVLAAAGCGGSTSDPVAWTDKVCGALLQFTDAVKTEPNIDPNADPATTVKVLSDYLGTAATALQGSINGLDSAGPSPVKGGDEIVTKLKGTLGQFQSSFQKAKTQLDAVDTSDAGSLTTALPAAVAPLQELANVPNPTADLENNTELNQAAEKAPNCQKVRAAGG